TMFPDNSREAQVAAHRHGFPDPAALRQAILQNDAAQVASHAFANNQSPAASYFGLALMRGFKPKVTVGRSQEKAVSETIKHGSDADADAAWRWYSQRMRQAEGPVR